MIKKLMISLLALEGLLVGLLLLVMSCNQQKQLADTDSPLIAMEKTVCYGTCPVYKIDIYPNGLARYQGEKHVAKIGRYQRQLPPELIAELIRSFETDFWSLQDEYVADVTDLPTTYLSFQYQGRSKRVKHLINGPQQLTDLENRIVAIADSEDWDRLGD